MSPVLVATGLALLDPLGLVRVEDPDHPDRLSGTPAVSVLPGPPAPGIPWRWEPIPALDGWTGPEAVEVAGADRWHRAGITGAGVRVAIFDVGWFGPEADPEAVGEVWTHDCWIHPSCADPIDPDRPRLAHETGAHGYACAQTLRQIAPGVELHLVRTSSLAGFENAVRWAIREEIDLISMSMSFFNQSFYDGGPGVFDDLLTELEAHEILLVVSGGNHARKHWSGPWQDADGDGLLDFDGDGRLEVELPRDGLIYLNWNQHGRCGDTDLDAWVVDDQGQVYAEGVADQVAGADQCQPIERLRPTLPAAGVYAVQVGLRQGAVAGLRVDLQIREGERVDPEPEGSLADPGAHPLAFAVGAVQATGYLDNPPEPYSSWGPNHAGHPKPDIAGPDGLTVDAYGPRGFFGTSASAPAVAGMLALILEEDPSLSPRQAAIRLQGWAWGGDPRGADPRWGAGKARLPRRVPRALDCGRRPLIALLWLPPWGWLRRRRRRGPGVGCGLTAHGVPR